MFYHLAHVPNHPFIHGTWNPISCPLVKCLFLFFLHRNQKSNGTDWENIALTHSSSPLSSSLSSSPSLTYTNFGLFTWLTLLVPLFLSRSMAVNPMRIFFCYYNQTLSFFFLHVAPHIVVYLHFVFDIFFSSNSRSSALFVDHLLFADQFRIHNAIVSCFLDCFVESVYKCRRCDYKIADMLFVYDSHLFELWRFFSQFCFPDTLNILACMYDVQCAVVCRFGYWLLTIFKCS